MKYSLTNKAFKCIYNNSEHNIQIYQVLNLQTQLYMPYYINVSISQIALDNILQLQYPNTCVNWCFFQHNVIDDYFDPNILSIESIFSYSWYTQFNPILIAVQNGRIIANYYDIVSTYDVSKFNFEAGKLINYNYRRWRDIYDNHYYGIPIKIGNTTIEFNPETNKFM